MCAQIKFLAFFIVAVVVSNCTAVPTRVHSPTERPSVNLEAERARMYVPSPAIVSSEKSAIVEVGMPIWPTVDLVKDGADVYVVASQPTNASAMQLVPVYRFPAYDLESHAAFR